MSVDSPETVVGEHGRDRRKRLTRQRLRRATLELGLEHGLASVSVESIAARAGVSTRTFFNYFDTKEEAALLELFHISDAELTVLAAGGPESAWRDLTLIFVEDVQRATEDGDDFPSFVKLHEQNPVLAGRQLAAFAGFEARISAALITRLGGGPDARLRAPLMVGCCITAVRVGLDHWAQNNRREPVRVHVERALTLIAPAFGST